MNENITDIAINAIDKDREYEHTIDKEIETSKKKKKISRSTAYKSKNPKKEANYLKAVIGASINALNIIKSLDDSTNERHYYIDLTMSLLKDSIGLTTDVLESDKD